MIDVSDNLALVGALDGVLACLSPLPDGAEGVYVSAYLEAALEEKFKTFYGPDGEVFFVSGLRVPHAVWRQLSEAISEVDPEAGEEVVVVATYRKADGRWWAGAEFGAPARRWRSTPANFRDLAREVCPL